MTIKKSFEEINHKIINGTAVVVSAEEVIQVVKEKGVSEAAKYVDVVTSATFGPMCSTGAFLNFGHADPPIRMTKVSLNNVSVCAGLAAVDAFIGATEISDDRGIEYGGAHVICDLIDGKKIHLKATSPGTDCYPRKEIDTFITKESINEAYLFNPRNCYQNYCAATNSSDRPFYTYMGILQPKLGNVNYSTTGELSPLINDPYYRTIGIGTKLFIGGAPGYVAWNGTQFKSGVERKENGIPLFPGGTLAIIGDLKKMSTNYIQPAVFEKYGTSMFVGLGIPIPVLDEEMMNFLSIQNKDIKMVIEDYSVQRRDKPIIAEVSFADLRSGFVNINGKKVKTAPLSSLSKARKIAQELKNWIINEHFTLQEPIENFPIDKTLKSLEIKSEED